MYYWYEGNEKDDSVIKTFDEEELSGLNVNLPNESELNPVEPDNAGEPEANSEDAQDSKGEDTPTEESKKYDLPSTNVAKFKVEEATAMYPSLPESKIIIVASNLEENINVVIHGMNDGKYYVTTESKSECFDKYRDAKVESIREAVRQHKLFCESKVSATVKTFREIYESCKDTKGIQMIYRESELKAVYPKTRKCVKITYDNKNSEYVVESKVGSEVSVSRMTNRYMECVGKDHLIRSILLGGN